MYLKSIEVQGFKSFANKIVLDFKPGITGIVGPNGSGKSNVADAVRWVLGEQKIKQLRGSSMQDVIFSGTELRKPLSYASVAITLDNSDHSLPVEFTEVTVTRRLYRSGESEYMINNSPCRLKDVYELFYDTGIGKEGYSIIGQGQIDQILSGKPEDKRDLFDEAAGIVKFKRRKTETIKKLESEHANLLRINDILSEQERHIEPLQKQSEKAKVYLKKKEELKTLDVNAFLLDHEKVLKQLQGVQEKHEVASAELLKTGEQLEEIREEYDRVTADLEQLEREIDESQSTLTNSVETRSKLEGQIQVLKERIHSVEGNKEHLKERLASVQAQMDAGQKEKDRILSEKSGIDRELEQTKEKKDLAAKDLEEVQEEIREVNNQIEDHKKAIIDELNKRASTKTQMGRFDTMLEQVQIKRSELSSRLIRFKSSEEEADQLIADYEAELARITGEVNALIEKDASIQTRLAEIHDLLGDKDKSLQETREKYHQEKSKLEALSNLTERYEGYGGAVKMVMEQKSGKKGIIGVVADIISADKKYEMAIETALGGNIQNIVTEDEDTAKEMISLLKKNKGGRATFLPLTALEHPQEFKNPEALDETGVIGMADELVKVEKKYRNVAKAMLGRIVVVDNVDHAVKIARKYSYGIRMVTLEGELLAPGGAIAGGHFKNNSNLLGRRREIEELEGKVKELSEQTSGIEKEITDIREERNGLRVKAESARMQMQNVTLSQNTARINLDAAKQKKEETLQDSVSLKDEEQAIEKQIREIEENKKNVTLELETSEQSEAEHTAEIEKLQETLEELHERESSRSEETAKWDIEYQKMLQKQGFEQQNVDRIDGELSERKAEYDEIKNSMDAGAEEVEQKKEDIEAILATIEASHQAQTDAEKNLEENKKKRSLWKDKQKNFFVQRDELTQKHTDLDKEVYRLNQQKERQENYIENQINYMWNEYEITLSDAKKLRKEELTDLPSMKSGIVTLKDEIRKLGDVNVNAIEEYRELMERYTFTKTQRDDLMEAEKTLENIIQELDTAMRKQFEEKFAEICREFDKVFKELFGGGKGTIELMEGEDILEAGIIITAQPPGKKLVNMMQLSGGEKALTAIALLFAIQNLKPSPFCLLDEIEAALDENNVSRFAKYLHKLTRNTQFIVITHRRGTMEQADRLYGITMQEKGVSALVSVDLIDKDLDD